MMCKYHSLLAGELVMSITGWPPVVLRITESAK